MPCSRQRLNSWHRNSDRMSTFAFSNHVGSESERHCLLGSESKSFSTSAEVIGRKLCMISKLFVELAWFLHLCPSNKVVEFLVVSQQCITRCTTYKIMRDNYNLKSHKYVCITTYHPETKSNPNPNPTTKQHAIVNIQLNIVTCHTYPDKFIRDMLHRLYYFRL